MNTMDESTSLVFEMEEASTGKTNNGASSICSIEEATLGPEILNTDCLSKFLCKLKELHLFPWNR